MTRRCPTRRKHASTTIPTSTSAPPPSGRWRSKEPIGKLTGPADLLEEIARSGFRQLPISFEHAVTAGRLPPLHRDPFDRLLVAQARCEGLTIATRDPLVHRYEVDVLPV